MLPGESTPAEIDKRLNAAQSLNGLIAEGLSIDIHICSWISVTRVTEGLQGSMAPYESWSAAVCHDHQAYGWPTGISGIVRPCQAVEKWPVRFRFILLLDPPFFSGD
jgi:hypothetical protein